MVLLVTILQPTSARGVSQQENGLGKKVEMLGVEPESQTGRLLQKKLALKLSLDQNEILLPLLGFAPPRIGLEILADADWLTTPKDNPQAQEEKLEALAIDHNLANYDVWTETGRSAVEQQEFKERLIKYYKCRSFWKGDKIRCMMTGEWHRRDHVIAEHIWKHKMHGSGLHKFNLERKDTSSPRNGILMLKDVEDQFTVKKVCIVYNATTRVFTIKVLDPSILDTTITHSTKKFRDIHNTGLSHPTGRIPFRRLLSFHARCAYKFAREKGWINVDVERLFEPYHDLSDGASIPSIDTASNT
eukprot:gene28170-34018_t